MNTSLRIFVKLLLLSVLYWVFAVVFYIMIKYYGLETQMSSLSNQNINFPLGDMLKSAVFIGFSMGCIYAIVESIFDKFLSSRLILGLNIVIKSLLYFIVIVMLLSTARAFIEGQTNLDLPNERGWWHTNRVFWSTIAYFTVASIVFSFIRIANNKFGPGVLFNMLIGKYNKPKEESRILMFLDLKDSTTIAEILGHIVYSNFIQDCFIDLNKVLTRHHAQIYQYVGDEAVISWVPKKGFKNNNCINLFFAFQAQLGDRKQYYAEKYNFEPQFKAGVHCGPLMIAEVGTIKKEIAFHGDVINTAARIQGRCNALNALLLVSETVLSNLELSSEFKSISKGEITLKGKESAVNIFAIEKQIPVS